MIAIIIGIVGAIIIALDARRNLRVGFAKTAFGTYSQKDQPTAFRAIWGTKVALSIILLGLASVLLVWNAA